MQVFKSAQELSIFHKSVFSKGKSLGFVATMGALHEGHLALAKQSQSENDFTIVSIFVNPTQFNNPEDLEKYPRKDAQDIAMLDGIKVDAVFLPSVEEMYGQEVNSESIDLIGLDAGMEGDYRPGHFHGVATVVRRLLKMIKPSRAYFGEKDYQQLRIIKHVAEIFDLHTKVIGVVTQRYPSGLAMSSRNFRLSANAMVEAKIIYQSMLWAKENYQKYRPEALKEALIQRFAKSSLVLEYVDFADDTDMHKIADWQQAKSVRIYIAALCEGVRLIDNLSIR
jgi:pantoate--beta-alanine ligase